MGTSPSPSPSASASASASPSPSPSPSPSLPPPSSSPPPSSTSPSLPSLPSPAPLPPLSRDDTFYDVFLQYAIVSSFLLAVCAGLYTRSFKNMIVVYGVGVFLTLLVVVPDWEYFTKRPFTEWIEPMASDEESRRLQKERFPILKKTAKYAKREDINPFGIVFFIATTSACVYYTWKFVMS